MNHTSSHNLVERLEKLSDRTPLMQEVQEWEEAEKQEVLQTQSVFEEYFLEQCAINTDWE